MSFIKQIPAALKIAIVRHSTGQDWPKGTKYYSQASVYSLNTGLIKSHNRRLLILKGPFLMNILTKIIINVII